jgi:hypothetical protein
MEHNMQILSQVNNTRRQEGLRIVIAGQEKMGKTTLTCQAPGSLLVPLEIGYSGVTVAKTPMLQSYAQVEQLLGEIIQQAQAGQFPYRSIIFDSATALERMIHEQVLMMDASYGKGNKKAVTMESALGGYGRAYTYANEIFDRFLKTCDQLAVYGGINIILTCHVFAAKLIDPNSGEFDCWDLQLHSPKNQKTYGKREMITQWADIVGFLYEPMFVTKGENIAKGMSANKGRVMGLSRTPSYVAGNRFGFEGEVSIPKVDGWNHFANAIYQTSGINIFNV